MNAVKLVQPDYKPHYDRGACTVHWSIMKDHEILHTKSWYEHRADKVVESEDGKIKKWLDLRQETSNLWNAPTSVALIIIGAQKYNKMLPHIFSGHGWSVTLFCDHSEISSARISTYS